MWKKRNQIKSKLTISILVFFIIIYSSEAEISKSHLTTSLYSSIKGCLQKRDKIQKIVTEEILPWSKGEEIIVATVYPWYEGKQLRQTDTFYSQMTGRLYILRWNGLEYVEDARFVGIACPLDNLDVKDINGDGKKEIVAIGVGGTSAIITIFGDRGGVYGRIFEDTPKHNVEIKDIDGDKCKELLLETFAPEGKETDALLEKGWQVSVTKIYKWNKEKRGYELFKITKPHKLGETGDF